MSDRIDARISDEPTQGWVDDELGLILNPGCDPRITGGARARSGRLVELAPDGAPRAPCELEDGKQPA